MRSRMMRRLCAAMLGIVSLSTIHAAEPGESRNYRHFDLGVGSYGANWTWGSGTPLDIARMDWALLAFGNELVHTSTTDRMNLFLKMNPKIKFLIRLWPKTQYQRPGEKTMRYCGFLDYLYYPEAKKAFLAVMKEQIRLIEDNISNRDAVYGYTLYEELPHQLGGDVSCLDKLDGPIDDYISHFAPFYEKETGKKMTEWNGDVRRWWAEKFAECLRDVFANIRKESDGKKIFVWFMSHFRLLDWLEPGENPHSFRVIPIPWKDLIQPGVAADGFFAYCNNILWAKRYQKLAQDNHWPYFSQLSHSSSMRIGSWEECLSIAKTDIPENLGYFFYAADFTHGFWNDAPDVPEEDRPDLPGMYNRIRAFCAKEKINMDIVARYLGPEVLLDHDLGTVGPDDFGMVTAVIRNTRNMKWFTTKEDATLQNIKVSLKLPDGFTLPASNSCPAELTIRKIDPSGYTAIIWWAKRDRNAPPPADGKYPVSITVSADKTEKVTLSSEKPAFHMPLPERYPVANSGDKFLYINYELPWEKQETEITLESIFQCNTITVNPAIRCGDRKLIWNGVIRQGEKLLLGPGFKATLINAAKVASDVTASLAGEPISVGKGISEFEFTDEYPPSGSMKINISVKPVPKQK